MPAYSFQPRFVEPIRTGSKGGTIRAPRALRAGSRVWAHRHVTTGGHAYPGERLALYCRQRHPTGFKIAEARCVSTAPIVLDFAGDGRIVIGEQALTLHYAFGLEAFARFDGFESFAAMGGFWREAHGVDHFIGWHIRWAAWPPELGDYLDRSPGEVEKPHAGEQDDQQRPGRH